MIKVLLEGTKQKVQIRARNWARFMRVLLIPGQPGRAFRSAISELPSRPSSTRSARLSLKLQTSRPLTWVKHGLKAGNMNSKPHSHTNAQHYSPIANCFWILNMCPILRNLSRSKARHMYQSTQVHGEGSCPLREIGHRIPAESTKMI